MQLNKDIKLLGWLKSKRSSGKIEFLDIVDSSGEIGAVLENGTNKLINKISNILPESSIKISGKLKLNPKGIKEIALSDIDLIGTAEINISPRPRMNFKIFETKYADYVLKNRHLFIRNPKLVSVLRIKHNMLHCIRNYLHAEGFTEIDTPILTQATYYEDSATFPINYFGTKVFLSQCAGLYLNAALPAFEKVYTITPAFRAQPSRSPRHNPEFWHIKGQMAFTDLQDIAKFTENLIYESSKIVSTCTKDLATLGVSINYDKFLPPYEKISYDEALNLLAKKNLKLKWGTSLGADEEKILSKEFEKPFFIWGMPARVEPFPYKIDESNPKITKTADLLAPDGYGEILGIAEFISNPKDLINRMKDTGKYAQIDRLQWALDLRKYGCVPHTGFGIGVERLLRWLLKLHHIRDTIPFPRLYNRIPYP